MTKFADCFWVSCILSLHERSYLCGNNDVEYTFDDSTNIICYDYEELGIWNKETESVEWYNSNCESIHIKNKSK